MSQSSSAIPNTGPPSGGPAHSGNGRHARLRAMLSRISEELSQQSAAVESAYTIASNSGYDLHEFSEHSAESIVALLNARMVTIRLLDVQGCPPYAWATSSEVHRQPGQSEQCNLCEWACAHGVHSEQHHNGLDLPPCAGTYDIESDSVLVVPIRNRHIGSLGTICVLGHPMKRFSAAQRRSVEIFAHHLGYEIERRHMSQQLKRTKRLATLGQLLAEVAHEVRNPLSAMMLLHAAIQKHLARDETLAVYGQKLGEQIHRISVLMSDLLDMRRGFDPAETQQIPVDEAVRDVVEFWRQTGRYPQRELVLSVDERAEKRMVSFTPVRFEQVLGNVLSNACEHSPDDQPLHIRVTPDGETGVQIALIDRGTGIPPQDLPHLFEPLFTTRQTGNGLGLAVVKQIVESHGGTVTIRNNTPEPGASAIIRLPGALDTEHRHTPADPPRRTPGQ